MALAPCDARGLFLAVLERPPEERAAYLDEACAGDAVLRQRVEALLRAHDEPGAFLSERRPDPNATSPHALPSPRVDPVIAGRYRLLEEIGEGGMGTVWMAEQREPVKRLVAIKLIKAGMDSKAVLTRFEAERQALALMDHPHIAKVLDGGFTQDGHPFFVMELVKGLPLTEYCDSRRLSVNDRLELFVQICSAVQHAHQKGIIHRDLKPSNVLITEHDGKPVPKVIDFGLAKALGATNLLTERTFHTAYGTVVGTPLYMAPEQVGINALDVDTRTDIYALGVILYELLTGTTPLEKARFKEAAWGEIKRLIREEEPPRPSMRLSSSGSLPSLAANRGAEPAKLTRLLRGELDWIVMKALDKDRSRRYETANALVRDIQRYLADEPIEARPPTLGYRLAKLYRKHRTALLTAATILLLLIAGIAVSTSQAIRATEAETTAAEERDVAVKAKEHAVEERDRANDELRQRLLAEEKEQATQYVLDIQTLPLVWTAGNFKRAREMLKRHDEKRRGFEWHYWDRKTHAERYTVALELPPLPQSPPGHTGHSEWVFSADGTRLALLQMPGGGGDVGAVLTVWDVASRRRLLSGHQTPAGFWPFGNNLQISRNGKRILIRRVAQVVDVESGKVLFGREFLKDKGLTLFPQSVGLSLDGTKCFALFQQEGQPAMLKVWDLSSGKELFSTVAGNTLPAFSPDGLRIVGTAPVDGKPMTKMWELASGKELWQGNGTGPLVFSPDGRLLASATLKSKAKGERTLTLTTLDADTGRERSTTSIPIPWKLQKNGDVDLREPLTFNPDGSRLAIGVTILELAGLQRQVRWFLVDSVAGGVLTMLDEPGFAFNSSDPEPANPFF